MYKHTSTSAARAVLRLTGSQSSQRYSAVFTSQQFSTTARNDVRSLFRETENPELSAIFKTIEEKVIFPAHLPQEQRKLVFNTADRSKLAKNPIIIELEGVEHKFETIDLHKQMPRARPLVYDAVKAMETDADFANLPTLLAGFAKANIHLGSRTHGKITRLALTKNKIRHVLECALQSKETGFFIATREQLAYLVIGTHEKLDLAAGDLEGIESCVKTAKTLLALLERTDHVEYHKTKPAGGWLQHDPLFRSLLLLTRARLYQAKKAAGQDYSQDLVLLTDEIKTLSSLWTRSLDLSIAEIPSFHQLFPVNATSLDSKEMGTRKNYLGESHYLTYLARHIQAIEFVQNLALDNPDDFASVSAEIQTGLVPGSRKVDTHLAEWLPKTRQPQKLGAVYNELVGREL